VTSSAEGLVASDVALGGTLEASQTPLAQTHDAALLDLDGVVYLGGHPIPKAAESIAAARAGGMRVAFVTNNASRTPAAIADALASLGVPAGASDVVTSAQAAARLVAERVRPGAAVLVVGGIGLRQAVREMGLRPVTTVRDEPEAVVQGFTPQISYSLLTEGALAVQRGAFYVASNADATLPTSAGLTPGNGSFLAAVRATTGREPAVAGKPEAPLHREAVLRTNSRRPLVVGDRLDTDIEGAVRAGTSSLLVLTGVTGPLDLLNASPRERPTYISADLTGLLQPHPAPHRKNGESWSCGGWTARVSDGQATVEGHGDPTDGLRALTEACWHADRPPHLDALSEAVKVLRLSPGAWSP
jgi:glycerol-1-phosphatase